MFVQPALCRTCSETTLLVFLRDGSFIIVSDKESRRTSSKTAPSSCSDHGFPVISNILRPTKLDIISGNKTRKLVECLEKTSNETNLSSRLCTRILRKECLKSKVRIIKTIRTRLTWLVDILEEFPNLKIVHLVRDPRAVVNSLIRVGKCKKQNGGVPGCSHYFCSVYRHSKL